MWAFYVKGYNPDKHCQQCFIGSRANDFCTPTAASGRSVALDRMDGFPYVYICGVSSAPKSERGLKNFHFPLRYAEGQVAEATTHNGY